MAEGRVIAFQVAYVPLCGVKATLLLCQALYWSSRKEDGWFFKTAQEWEEETGLTRREQEQARKTLVDLGFLQEVRRGQRGTLHYRVDLEKVRLAESDILQNRHSTKTTMSETAISDVRKPPIENGGNRQSLPIHEITTEITTEKREHSSRRVWLSPEALRAMDPEEAVARLAYLAEAGPIFEFTGGTLSPNDRFDLRELLGLWVERGVYPTKEQMDAATAAAQVAYAEKGNNRGKSFFWWKNKLGDLLSGKSPTGQALTDRDKLAPKEQRLRNPDHPDVPAKLLREQVGLANFSMQDQERFNKWETSKYELPEFRERHAAYYAGLNGKAGANGKH